MNNLLTAQTAPLFPTPRRTYLWDHRVRTAALLRDSADTERADGRTVSRLPAFLLQAEAGSAPATEVGGRSRST